MDLDSLPRREAGFVEPMECLAVTKLPEGSGWLYEIKLDGYRAIAINSKGKLSLYSRKRKPFHRQYPYIVEALSDLPENTVVDGRSTSDDNDTLDGPQSEIFPSKKECANTIDAAPTPT